MKLNSLLRDMRSINDGVWVKPRGPQDDLEVKARGYTPGYRQKAEETFNSWTRLYGSPTKAPDGLSRRVMADLLFEHCVIDLRGLYYYNGTPVTLAEAREIAGTINDDYDGWPLYEAMKMAVDLVDARRKADAEDIAGN